LEIESKNEAWTQIPVTGSNLDSHVMSRANNFLTQMFALKLLVKVEIEFCSTHVMAKNKLAH
jgi:hypothetical protein